jgi:hypothetical protein
MRASVAFVVSLLCAGCLGGSGGNGAQTARPSHLGVAAAFPKSWSVAWGSCRDCADPRGIFIAASYATARGPRGMVCSAVPDGDVVITLDEVLPHLLGDQAPPRSEYPPRPEAFHIDRLGRFQVYEGCDVPRSQLFRFRDAGRLLYAWAVFGPHPSRIRAQAEAVLNSLRVAPLP